MDMQYWIELGCGADGKPVFKEYSVPTVESGHKVQWAVAVLDAAGPRIYGVVLPPGETAHLRFMRFRSKVPVPKEPDGRYRSGRYELESGYVSPRTPGGSPSATAPSHTGKAPRFAAMAGALVLLAGALAVSAGIRIGTLWLSRHFSTPANQDDAATVFSILNLLAYGVLGLGGAAAVGCWSRMRVVAIAVVALAIPLLFFFPDYLAYQDAVVRLAAGEHVNLSTAGSLLDRYLDQEVGVGGPLGLYVLAGKQRFAESLGLPLSYVVYFGLELFYLGCSYAAAVFAAVRGPAALVPDLD